MAQDRVKTALALSGGQHDQTQVSLLDEVCLLVDPHDKPVGLMKKGECHLMTEIDKGTLHRAFSIFLFNHKGELCLQQRASEKITFPDYWTNTCCSHPIDFPDKNEFVEEHQLGIRRAAARKLDHEMNIKLPVEAFHFVTRILYKAPSNGIWGEHEVDYVLFARVADNVHVDRFNKNEVRATQYVTKEKLAHMITEAKAGTLLLTPWFDLITKSSMFYTWWDKFVCTGHAPSDAATIHDFTKHHK